MCFSPFLMFEYWVLFGVFWGLGGKEDCVGWGAVGGCCCLLIFAGFFYGIDVDSTVLETVSTSTFSR